LHAGDTCQQQSREGYPDAWNYGSTGDDAKAVSVGPDGITVSRQTSTVDGGGQVTASTGDVVSVGADGVTYTSTADAEFSDPSFDQHCAKTTSVPTADPTAAQVADGTPSCALD
jgi:hypothetical protein